MSDLVGFRMDFDLRSAIYGTHLEKKVIIELFKCLSLCEVKKFYDICKEELSWRLVASEK